MPPFYVVVSHIFYKVLNSFYCLLVMDFTFMRVSS